MLHKAQHVKGYTLESNAGEIGQVKEFHCDDYHWAIRYLVADLGHWFRDRRVLIPPSAIIGVNTKMQIIETALTRQQIDEIPALADGKSGSRPFEQARNPHLRSFHNLISSRVEGTDGDLGQINDFLIDLETWAIRYFIIDTHKWWRKKKVMISSKWIERVNWLEAKIYLNLTRETMKQAPEYEDLEPLPHEYETNLYQRWEDRIKPKSRLAGKREREGILEF